MRVALLADENLSIGTLMELSRTMLGLAERAGGRGLTLLREDFVSLASLAKRGLQHPLGVSVVTKLELWHLLLQIRQRVSEEGASYLAT